MAKRIIVIVNIAGLHSTLYQKDNSKCARNRRDSQQQRSKVEPYNEDFLWNKKDVLIVGCPHYRGTPLMPILCTYVSVILIQHCSTGYLMEFSIAVSRFKSDELRLCTQNVGTVLI